MRAWGRSVHIRMSADLQKRVRKYQKGLGEKIGAEVTFSTAVRGLIEQGLAAAAKRGAK